jgi:uncharacterized membrane protein YhhN
MPILFVVASLAIALVDWWSVAKKRPDIESLAKPLVMVPLIVAALVTSAEPGDVGWLLAAGLVGGLVGDVMLLERFDRFIVGLGAFLVGHLLYVVAFVRVGIDVVPLVAGTVVAGAVMTVAGRPILGGVDGSRLRRPVEAYMATIAMMVATGIGTGRPVAALGAICFALSDALLGHDRFVASRPDRRVVVHLLYHLGQWGIVIGLLA